MRRSRAAGNIDDMTPTTPAPRSFAAITRTDLERLAGIADADAQRLYARYPQWRERFVGTVLAQGAARHLLDGVTGVKDFDVWTFFARIPGARFPFGGRRKVHRDFGISSHGRQLFSDDDRSDPVLAAKIRTWEGFDGRRVDLMMRDLACGCAADPRRAIGDWLREGARTPTRPAMPSSWWLAQKAMVLLSPRERLGEVIWPDREMVPAP
jgi:hypothetical protein